MHVYAVNVWISIIFNIDILTLNAVYRPVLDSVNAHLYFYILFCS